MGLLSDWVDSVQHRFSSPEAFGQGLLSALTTNIGFTPEDLAYRYRTGEFRHAPELGFGLGGITAWHGSPHKFDKFDISKIGTGEGAQVYGHGLYFADRPETARTYKDVFSAHTPLYQTIDDVEIPSWIAARIKRLGLDDAISDTERALASAHPTHKAAYAADLDKLKEIKAKSIDTEKDYGHLYEVDIPDSTVAKMLDWDAPLSEQPESVRKTIVDSLVTDGFPLDPNTGVPLYVSRDPDGRSIYNALATAKFRGEKAASEYLHSLGIPGIKYWDGGSRAAGEGTRNYVVFDPELLTILSRNGLGLLD